MLCTESTVQNCIISCRYPFAIDILTILFSLFLLPLQCEAVNKEAIIAYEKDIAKSGSSTAEQSQTAYDCLVKRCGLTLSEEQNLCKGTTILIRWHDRVRNVPIYCIDTKQFDYLINNEHKEEQINGISAYGIHFPLYVLCSISYIWPTYDNRSQISMDTALLQSDSTNPHYNQVHKCLHITLVRVRVRVRVPKFAWYPYPYYTVQYVLSTLLFAAQHTALIQQVRKGTEDNMMELQGTCSKTTDNEKDTKPFYCHSVTDLSVTNNRESMMIGQTCNTAYHISLNVQTYRRTVYIVIGVCIDTLA